MSRFLHINSKTLDGVVYRSAPPAEAVVAPFPVLYTENLSNIIVVVYYACCVCRVRA